MTIVTAWAISPEIAQVGEVPIPPASEVSNTRALGQVLYTKYLYLFQASGLILLIAMIGAIVLTLRQREGVRRQVIGEQVSRPRNAAVEVKQVPSRKGV